MGLCIVLEDEVGTQIRSVSDPQNLLYRILPSERDDSYRCLRYVDAYGDTVFNHLQIRELRSDLAMLSASQENVDARNLLSAIDALAKVCEDGVHLYLKFYGD